MALDDDVSAHNSASAAVVGTVRVFSVGSLSAPAAMVVAATIQAVKSDRFISPPLARTPGLRQGALLRARISRSFWLTVNNSLPPFEGGFAGPRASSEHPTPLSKIFDLW